ncbi:MAG: ribonuclease III [Peptococcaceae bacterium]|nr:ribonuclease III [Peptococcaceae bacterium]
MAPKQINGLQQELGVNWNNPALFTEALTHSSYAFEHPGVKHNQRLEFLGDAVLEIVISEYLFRRLPEAKEGELTKFRATVVCEASLVEVARSLCLGDYLIMGRGEEASGGRNRPSVLADAVEALLGAVYLDQGLEVARRIILKYFEPLLEDVLAGRCYNDYKTRLQEVIQRQTVIPVKYVILEEKGPDHNKTFTAGVIHRGKLLGKGTGSSKKEAEQLAAREALKRMESSV